ncbi:MAG TPA: F0F1 ATP synthase subunit A [Nitriliruptorales bacterium]|nr:F0F1 ATP synthase subunit A [Nitriliruptorales bacterium]
MITENLLVAAEPERFEVPSLQHLFENPPFLFQNLEVLGVPLGFNRMALLTFVSVAILLALFFAAFRKPKVVPGKFQAVMEALVAFVRDYIVIEVIGPAGLKFVPFLTSLFLFIWISNFFEIMPLVQFPTTSRMALPAFLAFVVWTMFILVGVREQGPVYFKNVVVPPGVPWWVMPLVVPIELVSTFVVRPFTLSVRLFTNMVAGHILLAVIFIASNAFLWDVTTLQFNLKGSPIGILALAAGPLMVGFEFMVGVLQAYIFTILAAVYLSGSLHPEH